MKTKEQQDFDAAMARLQNALAGKPKTENPFDDFLLAVGIKDEEPT